MAIGQPCKRCERDCVKNGGLPFNFTVKIGDDGCPIINTDFLIAMRALGNSLRYLGCAQDCCLGADMSDHAMQSVEQWFFDHLLDYFAIECQSGKWKDCAGQEVPVQLSNIDIKVTALCNDDDIAQGKGPADADVDDDNSSFDVQTGPCRPPDDGSGEGGGGGGGGGMV